MPYYFSLGQVSTW